MAGGSQSRSVTAGAAWQPGRHPGSLHFVGEPKAVGKPKATAKKTGYKRVCFSLTW